MLAIRLTRGKLLKQDDWNDWGDSEFQQLNQYEVQWMFGYPKYVEKKDAIFNLVWIYNVKVADGRKKARRACDSSPWAGQVRLLCFTNRNYVDQTSSHIFYAVAAAEN